MKLVELTILGDVPSKKNRYRFGKGHVFKDKGVVAWEKSIFFQVRKQLKNFKSIKEPCVLIADFYMGREKDLDNMLTGLMDGLQLSNVLENDKWVHIVSASKKKCLKGEEPHVDIYIESVI